ncbi:hypothetical protein IH824_17025 [candidate division KSB1 bacterium]|nr:hypothetical protein [candidate division KSB1 bacterium]
MAESVGYLVGTEGPIIDTSGRIIGELVVTRLGQPSRNQWERASLQHNYQSPVVIAKISSYNGNQSSQIRLQAVDNNSFDFQIEEWAYLDGNHNFEDISYLVVEEGRHRLLDGTTLEAGTVTANHNWKSISFGTAFAGVPVILSQCMSRNGGDPVVTRQRKITNTNFEVRIQEEEAKGAHTNETVGFVGLHK